MTLGNLSLHYPEEKKHGYRSPNSCLKKRIHLLLDEPTNHLDLDSKEVLENALDGFPGTIVFVSHDRYFINRIATKVIDISANGAVEYLGDYDYFIEKKLELAELLAERTCDHQLSIATSKRKRIEMMTENKNGKKRRLTRAITEVEKEIADLDDKISQLQNELENPVYADDHVKLMELQAEIDAYQIEHDAKAESWLDLQEELEL